MVQTTCIDYLQIETVLYYNNNNWKTLLVDNNRWNASQLFFWRHGCTSYSRLYPVFFTHAEVHYTVVCVYVLKHAFSTNVITITIQAFACYLLRKRYFSNKNRQYIDQELREYQADFGKGLSWSEHISTIKTLTNNKTLQFLGAQPEDRCTTALHEFHLLPVFSVVGSSRSLGLALFPACIRDMVFLWRSFLPRSPLSPLAC